MDYRVIVDEATLLPNYRADVISDLGKVGSVSKKGDTVLINEWNTWDLRDVSILNEKAKINAAEAAEYEEYFKNVPDIEFFVDSPDTFSNYWLNAVILKDKEAQIEFLTQTNDNGVMTRPIWELMNRLPMFENSENDGLKNTIRFSDRVVNIPSSVRTSDLCEE